MHIEFLVEEPSAEAALKNLVPKIIGGSHTFAIHPHQGKKDLLRKLPDRLKGYARWIPDDYRIVVLIDEDREDCKKIKSKLEAFARAARLDTPNTAKADKRIRVVNRLAIEELEAWFFGDISALTTAYPRVSPRLDKRKGYRDTDSIKGGTWEALERVLRNAGYYAAGLPKIEVAKKISINMSPQKNTSQSFNVFRQALEKIVGISI